MKAERIEVGSFALWAFLRALQGVLALWVVDGILRVARFGGVRLSDVVSLILFVIVAVALDSFAFGWADEKGVHFRRYVASHFLPWAGIHAIKWVGSGLTIVMKDRHAWRQHVDFAWDVPARDAIREAIGRPLGVPNVVQWLHDLEKSGEIEGVEIRHAPPTRLGISIWREGRIDWGSVLELATCLGLFLLVLAWLLTRGMCH